MGKKARFTEAGHLGVESRLRDEQVLLSPVVPVEGRLGQSCPVRVDSHTNDPVFSANQWHEQKIKEEEEILKNSANSLT